MIPTMEKGKDGEAKTPPAVSTAQTDLLGAGGGLVNGRWEEAGKGDFFLSTNFNYRAVYPFPCGHHQ